MRAPMRLPLIHSTVDHAEKEQAFDRDAVERNSDRPRNLAGWQSDKGNTPNLHRLHGTRQRCGLQMINQLLMPRVGIGCSVR